MAMDHTSLDVPLLLALVLYLGSWVSFWAHLARPRPALVHAAFGFLAAGAAVHALAMGILYFQTGSPPATSGLAGFSVLAWTIAVTFLYFARSHPLHAMGAFAAPLVFINLSASMLFAPPPEVVPQALKTGYFVLHISLAFMGDALLAVAAVASAVYVIQERNLRLKKMMPGSVKMPALAMTDHLAYHCVTAGFLFMSLGIVSGIIYSKHAWHSYWSWDPRQVWSLITWLGYALLLHARLTSGWRGRRWAWLAMAAFASVVAAAVVLDVFKWGRHSGTYDVRPTAVETAP